MDVSICIPVGGLLTLLFIILKLCAVIYISWWYIIATIIIDYVIAIVISFIVNN
jgi:hypothetical protein